jgi:hypothetical protein
MDKPTIVIIANIAYAFIFLVAWWNKRIQHKNEIDAHFNNPDRNTNQDTEYFVYTPTALYILPLVAVTLFRNSHVFYNWVPTGFIVQFSVQFLILILIILPDRKWSRLIASHLIIFFLSFGLWNGLFPKDPKSSKLEMTTIELKKLTEDIDSYNRDLSNRLKKINEDMALVLQEAEEKKKEIDAINDVLKTKEEQHKQLTSIIEIDETKAKEILTTLNVHPPTLKDRILDALIGAILGYLLTLIRWRKIKWPSKTSSK